MITETRRRFLVGTAAAVGAIPIAGFPAIVKRRGTNSLLSHACIGTGNMANTDLNGLSSHPDIHITALCDVDSTYLERAKKRFPEARIYRDAFEMFAAEGDRIDSVNVSTPDHTHAQYILEALRRGLNVYGQKPLCHELADCAAIENLVVAKKAVTQMGTQIAAWDCDRRTVAAIRSGKIGEIRHVWLFSTIRDEMNPRSFVWPRPADPVPSTLDWKLWLGPAKSRPYSKGFYHPGTWRIWRDFGSAWLGDLAIHLMSPVWMGLNLGKTRPLSVVAEVSDSGWTEVQKAQFWPEMSHVTWTFPGIPASGGKPFDVEWCDGYGNAAFRLEPKFLPPAFLHDIAAQTPLGKLPGQGRIIEGAEGWILSTHLGKAPCLVMKNGTAAPGSPDLEPTCSHWHEYVNACLQRGTTTSGFGWTARMTEMTLLGNVAQVNPGEKIDCARKLKGTRA